MSMSSLERCLSVPSVAMTMSFISSLVPSDILESSSSGLLRLKYWVLLSDACSSRLFYSERLFSLVSASLSSLLSVLRIAPCSWAMILELT
jgi:hypothetical protein